MPLADLLRDRVRTASGVEVQPPTVRAFFRALRVFGDEVSSIREAATRLPGGVSLQVAAATFMITPQDGRLAYVLDGLVSPESKEPISEALAVARFIEPLVPQLVKLFSPSGDGDEPDHDVDPGVSRVVAVAKWQGVDPLAVMDWPLGLFLDVIDLSSDTKKAGPPEDVLSRIIPTTIGGKPIIGGPTRAEA
jgi:hypothetical protein